MFEDFLMDVRLAVRGMVRAPAQAGVLILTLALGMGATTAIFSVLQGVLFAPLAYDNPEELISIRHAFEIEAQNFLAWGAPIYWTIRTALPASRCSAPSRRSRAI